MMNRDEKTGILYRSWPAAKPKAIFLLVHGLGGHSHRWEATAEFFAAHNFSSYAIELKGFGETEHLKGHVDSFETYYTDIRRLYDIIKEENGAKDIFLAGESLGGILSFLMAIREPGLFAGLICISPAFVSKLKFSFFDYLKIFSHLLYKPEKQFNVPFDSAMCTRDTHYQAIMDGNHREHRFATSKLLFNTLIAQVSSVFLKNKLKIPVLFLLAGNDMLVNPQASKKVFNGLKVKDKTMIQYPDMHHALSIDLGKEKVFGDILRWAQEKI